LLPKYTKWISMSVFICYCLRERGSFEGYSCHPYCHICVSQTESSRPAVARIAEIVNFTDVQIRIYTCSLLCVAHVYSVVHSDCIVTFPPAKHHLIDFRSIAETVFTAQYVLNL
jgi:hypothetical protein